MVSKDLGIVGPLKVRYKGIFDLTGLLKFIYQWYQNNQYDYEEKLYKDKIESAFGNEIEVEMIGTRRVTEYYQYIIEVKIHTWESKEVVVKAGSRETKMMNGRMEITVEGKITRDWQGRFIGAFWEKAQKFMDEIVVKNEFLVKHAGPMELDVHAFNRDIKRFLKIEAS